MNSITYDAQPRFLIQNNRPNLQTAANRRQPPNPHPRPPPSPLHQHRPRVATPIQDQIDGIEILMHDPRTGAVWGGTQADGDRGRGVGGAGQGGVPAGGGGAHGWARWLGGGTGQGGPGAGLWG